MARLICDQSHSVGAIIVILSDLAICGGDRVHFD